MSDEEELVNLKSRLADAEGTIQALLSGQVDAMVDSVTNTPLLLSTAQGALRRSEQNFRTLIEQLPDQVWVHRRGRVIYVNANTVQRLGYESPAELVGHDFLDFVIAEDQGKVQGHLERVLPLAERSAQQEWRLKHRDGSTVVIEVSGQGIVFDGEEATLKVAHDITQRKQIEAHLLVSDRMASIGMLAAGVAHEINNPLAYVIANQAYVAQELTELIGTRPDLAVPHLDEMLVAIKDSQEGAERVRSIVRDLKMFSRADDAHRDPAPVDVHRMLNAAANMAWNEIRHRARLVKDYAPEALLVEGDESRLGQVFLNLLINAAQAIAEGDAEKNEVRILTRAQADGRVVIEVRDSGPGMTSEVQRRLFTPFFTTKAQGIGTGLGLSICHKIVSSHGGEIQVMSEVGKGTTFRVLLPTGSNEISRVKLEPLKTAKGKRGRVLVIDDEVKLGAVLRRILESDHDVETVTNGTEALRLISAPGDFDVIFCDLMMPEMSGREVYQAIAAKRPELCKRMVFVTGGVFTENARVFLERTPNLRVDKPFEVGQILSIVAQFVDR